MDKFEYTISHSEEGMRIDHYLTQLPNDYSRSYLQKLIQDGFVTIENKPVKANYRLKENDSIQLIIPAPVSLDIPAEDIPLDIKYEDADLLIINKPKGMVVHPAAGHTTGTLVNALLYHCKNQLSSINGVMRPGIVHRIDKDTTGLLIVCKNDKAHQCIAEQLKVHSITRKYKAIVYHNIVDDFGTIDKPIGRHPIDRKRQAIDYKNGKEAITHYRVLERLNGKYAYIECQLETGRTHQIRVHMASINHALLGDAVYGPSIDTFHLQGQTLHAGIIGFVHPTTNEYMEFESPLPEYFKNLLNKLR